MTNLKNFQPKVRSSTKWFQSIRVMVNEVAMCFAFAGCYCKINVPKQRPVTFTPSHGHGYDSFTKPDHSRRGLCQFLILLMSRSS